MPTQEIDRNDWVTFCRNFSQQHQGGVVTLEEFDSRSGAYVVTWDLALESVAADVKPKGGDTVSITVNEAPKRQIKHIISGAATINLEETDEGEAKALEIRSNDGLTMALHVDNIGLADTMLEQIFDEDSFPSTNGRPH